MSIRKVLHEDETYLLTDDYAVCNDELKLEKTIHINKSEAISTLYDVKGANEHIVHVEVSAIVGKNGDGKSTIVEVMLRLINNFAYSFGYTHDQSSLKQIRGLNAILYYEIKGAVYSIKCVNSETEWFCNGERIVLNANTPLSKKKELKAEHADKLFYSLVINYSLYAYNSVVLRNENDDKGCWIDELFHKNDSYQTPIVLNPMRDKGNIDVNKEEYLSKQRLISLFTTVNKELSAEDKRESRMISETEMAIGYAFKLEEESKFVRKTIFEYFADHKNTYFEWPELKNAIEKRVPVNENIIGCIQGFLQSFYRGRKWYIVPSELLKVAIEANERHPHESTDLSSIINAIINTLYQDNMLKARFDLKLFNSFKNWNKPRLSYAQLYRLILVNKVWDELTSDGRFHMLGADLNDALKQRQDKPKAAAMLYVLYKMLSIRLKYPSIAHSIPLSDDKFSLLQNLWPNEELISAIRKDIDAIYNTRDYRTLKLYQTLHYLERTDGEWYGATTDMPRGIEDYDHFIDFDKLKLAMKSNKPKEAIEFLPSPIFDGDIVLKNHKNCYMMNTLSSGMTQRLNSVGSFVYHLRNLDDKQIAKNLIDYKNVVAVFEEVELYFHPEYQKSYLKFLLKQIERTYLQRIEEIHIIFVTHSPFILSDVLKENILCLRDGGMDRKVGFDTFGANIHNLLRLPFFMRNGTIGDYAQKTINQIVAALKIYKWNERNTGKTDMCMQQNELIPYFKELGLQPNDFDYHVFQNKYTDKIIYDLISLLDEPLARHSLMELWNGCFCKKTEREQRIEFLKAELDRLERE